MSTELGWNPKTNSYEITVAGVLKATDPAFQSENFGETVAHEYKAMCDNIWDEHVQPWVAGIQQDQPA